LTADAVKAMAKGDKPGATMALEEMRAISRTTIGMLAAFYTTTSASVQAA